MDVEQRARFEEWITKVYPDRDLEKWPDGKYAYSFAALAWEVWRAALTPTDGYVLVPVEPTEAMVEASMIRVELAKRCGPGTLKVLGARAWDAMIAARPEVK